MNTKKILVLCTGNSCRSQMAEGYLRVYAGNRADIYSAGIEAQGVNSYAIRVMAEEGIDISGHTSNPMSDYTDMQFDIIITVCDNARERCPYFPGDALRMHFSFSDPADARGSETEILTVYRSVRDKIREFSRTFAYEQIP